MIVAGYILLGLVAGGMTGLIGFGGGIIIIPALVFLFKLTQPLAQGTTLALMLPPIGLFAVINYAKRGYVNFYVAALICLGFLLGGWFGSRWAVSVPKEMLSKFFGMFLLCVGLYMILKK
jgi:uncharacterized protein